MRLFNRSASPKNLDAAGAAAGAAARELLLVDVREPAEYRGGHGVDAQLVPLGTLSAELPRLAKAGMPVAFVCRSGGRSGQAVRLAKAAGVEALNVSGGMIAWERAGVPVQTGAAKKRR
jgi:rhodanese-related sulfurtransferase